MSLKCALKVPATLSLAIPFLLVAGCAQVVWFVGPGWLIVSSLNASGCFAREIYLDLCLPVNTAARLVQWWRNL